MGRVCVHKRALNTHIPATETAPFHAPCRLPAAGCRRVSYVNSPLTPLTKTLDCTSSQSRRSPSSFTFPQEQEESGAKKEQQQQSPKESPL